MEVEIKLNRWKYLKEQMQECGKELLKNRNCVEELLQSMKSLEDNQEWSLIRRKIKKYSDFLEQQEKRVYELFIVLEKVETYYIGCEEEIMEDGEISRKRFTEEIQTVELEAWKFRTLLFKR